MSGGLDSAVASAILAENGHEVIGVYLCLQKHKKSEELAIEAAKRIGVPLVMLPAEDVFEREVARPFLEAYRSGLTPNPCVICNEKVKFALLHSVAESYGADAIATGHYARTGPGPGGAISIFRGVDPTKDQSYMLYRVAGTIIDKAIFPLGELNKSGVTEKGSYYFAGLFDGVGESEDLCFASRRELGKFIENGAGPFPEGGIVTLSGERVGTHKGLHMYTVGQRKGLAISGGPWFVCSKNLERNELVVGKREDVGVRMIKCSRAVWREDPVTGSSLSACHRYRSDPVDCVLDSVTDSSFSCLLSKQLPGVAPGQSLVLYSNDRVCGGGIIEKTWRGEASANEQ